MTEKKRYHKAAEKDEESGSIFAQGDIGFTWTPPGSASAGLSFKVSHKIVPG